MRHFNRLCAAFVLACALTSPALAGEMSAGIVAAPPPPATATTQTSEDVGSSVVEEIATFLQSMLFAF